ncbi:FAD-dependent oxidoreductase [Cognatishimia activa]|uniref:Glycine oxidase n=1 Tax=Cognatishimia activa TaxID=1715691 RepID=A0A0P1IUW9_9RHOB|nr:FAD-dependent oxidoreductase [Cognatishimia activa]CUI49059.1 Glycine oxidase [Cognatishimia activa]CUK27397.1 Glycine oxidase [Cognatishimia activa]
MSQSVTILGSGVVGLTVAAELHQRRCDVTVIDPNGAPGPHGCSWWAGGMLAPDCEGEVAEELIVRLGREAAEWWQSMGAELTYQGSLVVALGRDRQELDRFARRTENHKLLDQAGLAGVEPHLSERFNRALFMDAEAHLNPRKTISGLRDRLSAEGVTFLSEGTAAGQVVDCRGLAAKDALPELRGVKGEMVILRAPDVEIARPVRLLHPRFPLYIVPRGDGVFMLGATQIESEERDRATVRSVVELLNAAYALHPAFGEAELLEIGVDARPAFPDNLPRISGKDGIIYVNGLFRHGYLLAPAMARMVGELVVDGKSPEVWHEV